MLDIKKIRADFDGVAAKLATRGVEKEKLEKLHNLDIKRRELIVKSEALKAERNSVSDEISQVKRAKGDASAQIAAMQKVSAEIKAIDAELAEIEENLNEIIIMLPNLPHESTPIGADEDDNVEVRRVGQTPTFNFEPKAHWDLGEDLGFLIGNVVVKSLVHASFFTKVLAQDLNVHFITSCLMSTVKKVILK
ncbi:Serine--tRNA ligase [Lactococcus lactis]|nr:Serine--tRNA ligase [Lactococcus lactis]